MANDLLKYMLLEETRLHSELRGNRSFYFFPFVIVILSAVITYFMDRYSTISGSAGVVPGFLLVFFSFGIMSGTFGLHATDYLERRFGDFGRLFSNAMVLPVKLRDIFMTAAASDSIFYFGWFIIPVIAGAAIGLLAAGASIIHLPLLLLATAFAFILGISISFFLTVLLSKSKPWFYIVLAAATILSIYGFMVHGMAFFLPYYMYALFSPSSLVANLLLIAVILMLTARMIGNEFSSIRTKSRHSSLDFGNRRPYLFKDFIDLYRTHGLVAKPLFNVVIPSAFMMLVLGSIDMFQGELAAVTNNLVFVGILLGTLSINFFNVLLSGDSYDYYVFLPASLRDFILPKMLLSQVICSIIGIVMLSAYAGVNSTFAYLPAGILMLLSFIFYTMCTSLFINGLKPNENSLNITSLGYMMVFFLPVILAGMVLPFLFASLPVYLAFAALLVIVGIFFYRTGLRKWTGIIGA